MSSDRNGLPYSDPRRGERLQRVLADAGIAARRLCERIIEEGRVTVNGERLTRLPVFADPDKDRIAVDGRPLPKPQRLTYIMLNKPTKVLSTIGDNQGDRGNALSYIDHPARPRLFPVGGLDFDTSGLMLFTNDGELANQLTHPRFQTTRLYHVALRSGATPAALATLRRGVYVIVDEHESGEEESKPAQRPKTLTHGEGPMRKPRRAGPARGENPARLVKLDAKPLPQDPTFRTLEVTATTARDVEIAKALHLAGLSVKRIERVAIGPLWLKGLAAGQWRELDRKEILSLKRAGGKAGSRGKPTLRSDTASGRARTKPAGAPLDEAAAKVLESPGSIPKDDQAAVPARGNPLIRRRRKVSDEEIDF